MLFTKSFFRRLLSNVRPGVAYYPIIFSQYDPGHVGPIHDNFQIREMNGFWREYGYGMVALYKSDFDKAGGFDVKIEGMTHNKEYDSLMTRLRMGSGRCLPSDECFIERIRCVSIK